MIHIDISFNIKLKVKRRHIEFLHLVTQKHHGSSINIYIKSAGHLQITKNITIL